ncbi:MAG TPA: Y-family DNA polymerase, partial [Flavisolibacter sp.]|nr:Y-family DNA polymerase [Flavisolibacter sp.]
LSNNDGCIISRTDEAKAIGVGMALPYFKAKDIIQKNEVAVFSSNYNLYGNLSWRVMETLKELVGKNNVEVYSVDEAFLDLDTFDKTKFHELASDIRTTVELWTGIKVTVGIAPTKTLAKLANNLAKKNKALSNCIMVLDKEEKIREALAKTKVAGIWGVGRQFADKLNALGINTGWDLYNMSEGWMRANMGGVVGMRLLKELHGEQAIGMEKELTSKKMIATTRMFGNPVLELNDIKEAVATYTSRAAEKLRRQQSAASVISVFIVPKEDKKSTRFRHGPVISSQNILASPTALTNELIMPAIQIAERIFEQGRSYKKAGVILSGLVPDNSIQANLFNAPSKNVGRFLMEQMDNINFSMRDDVVKFASSGTTGDWKMRQDYHSPRYTTRWGELFDVK